MSCQQLLSAPNGRVQALQTSFLGSIPARIVRVRVGFNKPPRRAPSFPCIKCEKKDDEPHEEEVSIERFPYYSYLDSTSGRMEPASGARASIAGPDYWPEGTSNRVRAARAPEPTGESEGSPSFGKHPGSRRKKYKTSVSASESSETSIAASEHSEMSEAAPEPSGINVTAAESSEMSVKSSEPVGLEFSEDAIEEPKDILSEYVVYQTETEEEETGYELDKKLGRPHPFIDPKVRKPIEETRPDEELWWHRRKPEKEFWSRWQRRRPDSETVFLKAMAETGQVKLYGEHPTLTETSLYRARRHLFKEERLQAERERLDRIGPMAYYSEWVEAWTRDTSHEAIQKHFEETGEDETDQLIQMFSCQTDREYRIMMGCDTRIRRDPLAMRMREDQIKQIWGGDPVYPTVNYIQDPNEVIDYRGANFHEPTPKMLNFLMEHGKIISREEINKILEMEKPEEIEIPDTDDAMARAVDIGETEDEGENSDVDTVVGSEIDIENETAAKSGEEEEETAAENEEEDEKLTVGWSILKSTPELRKSKPKPKKEGPMSLKEAVEDSENLTDFLLDFDEDK